MPSKCFVRKLANADWNLTICLVCFYIKFDPIVTLTSQHIINNSPVVKRSNCMSIEVCHQGLAWRIHFKSKNILI